MYSNDDSHMCRGVDAFSPRRSRLHCSWMRALLFGFVGFGNQRVQFPLFRLRISYCVKAGKTTTIPFRNQREKSWSQMGFTLNTAGHPHPRLTCNCRSRLNSCWLTRRHCIGKLLVAMCPRQAPCEQAGPRLFAQSYPVKCLGGFVFLCAHRPDQSVEVVHIPTRPIVNFNPVGIIT